MKQLLILLLLFSVLQATFAQKLYPWNALFDSLVFIPAFNNHVLMLEKQPESSIFIPRKDFPKVLDIRIEEADIVLEYNAGNAEDASTYTFALSLKLPDGQVVSPEPTAVEYRNDAKNKTRNLVWHDAAEWIREPGFSYTLSVQRSLMGAVNCESGRPSFSVQQKIPYYAVAGTGLVLIGLGQVYRQQKNDFYKTYELRWTDGASLPENKADDPREKALKKNRSYQACTWIGVGLLLVDGAVFARKSVKIKQKQRLYDKHCGKQPSLQLNSPDKGIGFLLKF